MNEDKSTTPLAGLIVVGASGRIGREVARLGVAYGAEVFGICLDGLPPNDEPWTQGVTWLARDAAEPGALDDLRICPVVVAAPIEVGDALVERFGRVVVVHPEGTVPVQGLRENVITATPGPVDDSPLDEDGSETDLIRVETVGMALLRAALDDGLPSYLGPDELAYFGDAVMLQ